MNIHTHNVISIAKSIIIFDFMLKGEKIMCTVKIIGGIENAYL